jgi:hypothetical protein
MAERTPEPHRKDDDHECWTRFFVAALSGAEQAFEPTVIATQCAEIADAALREEQRRRRQEPGQPEDSVYATGGTTPVD